MGEVVLWAMAHPMEAIALLGAAGGTSVGLVMAVSKAAGPIERLIRAWKIKRVNGKDNGNGLRNETRPEQDTASTLPRFMTRKEGDALEDLLRERTHQNAQDAQKALSMAEVVDRRQDKHSRILMEVQKEHAEFRGEVRTSLKNLGETCEGMKGEQKEQRTLLQAVAAKLGVDG